MTKKFGYPVLGLFILYLITLNASETGVQGNEFLGFVGNIGNALLDFAQGLAGGEAATAAIVFGL